MSSEDKIRYSAVVGHNGKAYIGINLEEDINTLEGFDDGDSSKPKFIKSWWTDINNKEITKAKLGDTVYFHIKTENIDDGKEVTLKLNEYDYNFFIDWIDPDDDEFNDEEIKKKAWVHSDKIKVEIILNESWQGMIKDDSDNSFSLDESLELYWKVKCNGLKEELPKSTKDYLSVSFSDRTLYFNLPMNDYNLPDMRSTDGSPLVYLEFMGGMASGKLKGKALDYANSNIEKAIHKIALGKLEKGSLATNMGRVQTNPNAGIYKKDIYSNDGKLLENLKKRKNWGNATETTKGISQYDFFSKTGKRVKILGFLKDVSFNKKVNLFDLIDLFNYATDETDPFDQPLPDFGIGVFGRVAGSFALVWNVAGLLVAQMKAEDDAFMQELHQMEIEKAKLQGLEAVRREINTWNHNKDYQWFLIPVSKETASKLLQGEFRTFDELRNTDVKPNQSNVEILYRQLPYDETIDKTNYIIETIFINE